MKMLNNIFNNNKGMVHLAIIMAAILVIIVGAVAYAKNGNGLSNWFYDDVQSGTDVVPNCEPKKYLVNFKGSLDLINQKQSTWSLDYEIDYLDAHIYDIYLEPLAFMGKTFEAEVCLYDVLAGGDNWDKYEVACQKIAEKITFGQIEKYPFSFKYNLYDNDCNGQVDDHTFNLVVELSTEDGKFERHEKTVAIVGGKAVFQNAEGY